MADSVPEEDRRAKDLQSLLKLSREDPYGVGETEDFKYAKSLVQRLQDSSSCFTCLRKWDDRTVVPRAPQSAYCKQCTNVGRKYYPNRMSDTAARTHLHELLVVWEELLWAWLKLLVGYSSVFTNAQKNELNKCLSAVQEAIGGDMQQSELPRQAPMLDRVLDLDERCERDQWQGVVGKRCLGIFVLTASFKKIYKSQPNAELLTIYLGEEGPLLPMKYKKRFPG